MSFENEIQEIPENLEHLVQGDVKIGKVKIPKIAIAGGVIGLVVFLAIRARGTGNGVSGGSDNQDYKDGSTSDTTGANSASGLDSLQPLQPTGLNSNPLAAIPLPDIQLPDLLPNGNTDFGNGYSMPDLSGFNIPVMASVAGNPFGNTGILGDAGTLPAVAQAKIDYNNQVSKVRQDIGKLAAQPAKNLGVNKQAQAVSSTVSNLQKAFSPVTTALNSVRQIVNLALPQTISQPKANGAVVAGVSSSHIITPSQLVGLPKATNVPYGGVVNANVFAGSTASLPKVNVPLGLGIGTNKGSGKLTPTKY